MLIISQIFLENLIKDKFFVFVFFSGIIFGFTSIIFNEISYGANEFIVRSFSFGFLSILTNFLSIYFGLTMIHGDDMRNSMKILLCKPLYRFELVLAPVFAFSIGLMLALIIVILEFMFLFKFYGVEVKFSYSFSVLGIFFEGVILFLLSMLFRSFANGLISTLIVSCLYVFGHTHQELLALSFVDRSPLLKNGIVISSKILPDFTFFNLKHTLYNSVFKSDLLINSSLYFLICLIVIAFSLVIIFSRKDYH